MKSNKKIQLLQKDILNAMKAINEINGERLKLDQKTSSGMVILTFGSKSEIATFGNFDDFHESLFDKAKQDKEFREVLQSVERRFLLEDLERKCFSMFDLPVLTKEDARGFLKTTSQIKKEFDEITKIAKEFMMTKSGERQSRFEEKNQK